MTPARAHRLARLRRLATLLDSAIALPFGRRIGLDGLAGLVPGVGDAATSIVSLFIVYEGARLGASPRLIAKMLANVGLDALVGTVPIVGDWFDFAWKANLRNVKLLEDEFGESR